MVKEFKMQGKVTLDRVELTQAIKEYVMSKEQLTTNKFHWLADGSVQLEVESRQDKPVMKKNQIVNKGFFPAVRTYLDSALRLSNKVTFADLMEIVKVEFPAMDEKRLNIYLHDRRQLPNIAYDSTARVIKRK